MSLNQFIAEAIKVLGTDANEIVIEGAKPMRNNPGAGEQRFVNDFNAHMLALFSGPAGDMLLPDTSARYTRAALVSDCCCRAGPPSPGLHRRMFSG